MFRVYLTLLKDILHDEKQRFKTPAVVTPNRFPSLLAQSMVISCKKVIKARVSMIDHSQQTDI